MWIPSHTHIVTFVGNVVLCALLQTVHYICLITYRQGCSLIRFVTVQCVILMCLSADATVLMRSERVRPMKGDLCWHDRSLSSYDRCWVVTGEGGCGLSFQSGWLKCELTLGRCVRVVSGLWGRGHQKNIHKRFPTMLWSWSTVTSFDQPTESWEFGIGYVSHETFSSTTVNNNTLTADSVVRILISSSVDLPRNPKALYRYCVWMRTRAILGRSENSKFVHK